MVPPEEEAPVETTVTERSESFRSIVQRHQELSAPSYPHTPSTSTSPPLKRPGILKKPKDWSSPSPQEIPSPLKEESVVRNVDGSESLPGPHSSNSRKTSMESTIEIQLNPSQSSSIVVHKIPAEEMTRLNRSGSTSSTVSSALTLEYNSLQEVNSGNSFSSSQRPGLTRKLSVEVEASPELHTSSVTLPTLSGSRTSTSYSKFLNRIKYQTPFANQFTYRFMSLQEFLLKYIRPLLFSGYLDLLFFEPHRIVEMNQH